MHADPVANQASLMERLSRAKFTLSFSNAVSPASYTHPTREYLTGRWTDALASGAVVAGIAPACAATAELLWPAATLELATVDRADGDSANRRCGLRLEAADGARQPSQGAGTARLALAL